MISGVVAQESIVEEQPVISQEIAVGEEAIDVQETLVEEEAEETKEEVKISEEELLNMAIQKDIETSSLDELFYWAESLGLSASKNEQALKNTLYNHYGLKPEFKTSKEEGAVKIEQAEYSTYYTVEDVDENIAEFEGRVKVIIVDDNGDNIKNNDKTHTVIADKINFNRSENSFSAIGNVEYVTQSPGVPAENIKGDSMTFNLDNWRGSILKCISEQEKEVNEEKQTFYYVTGEIKKSSSEVMGMDDVYIQTVEGSPYFNVNSTNMWMLNSSDYMIFSPFIRIGHVPVMWVPFYYHSENSLYFNPRYGLDNRRGAVFNNTVYLIGKKPKNAEDTQFSFLAYNMKETTNYDMNNMTLIPNEDTTAYSDDYLKFMFDYYSKLGFYIGNSGDLNFLSDKLSIKMDSGVAFSRNVDESSGEILFSDDNESQWNKSYFRGTKLPFRYLFEISLQTEYVKLRYHTYSDIHFKNDFYDREEDFLWVNYFTDQLDEGIKGLSDNSTEDESYKRETKKTVSSYTIGFDIVKDLSLSPEVMKPFLKSFKLSSDEFIINYASKDLEKSHELYEYIPGYKFFYPKSAKVPFDVSLNGSFFDTSFKRTVKKETETKKEKDEKEKTVIDPLFTLENPYKEEVDKTEEEKVTEVQLFSLEAVSAKNDLPITDVDKGLISSSLSYSFNSPIDFDLDMDNEVDDPDEIEYEYKNENLIFDVVPKSDVTFKFKTSNNVFSMEDKLSGKLYYKQFVSVDEKLLQDDEEGISPEEEADRNKKRSELNRNYQYHSITLGNNVSASLKPLEFIPKSKHSFSIDYTLNHKLYEKKYKEMDEYTPKYNELFPEWNKEIITAHKLSSSYTLKYPIASTTLSHTKTLDPLDEKDEFSTNLKLIFWDIDSTFTWKLVYDEELIVTKSEVQDQLDKAKAENKTLTDSEKLEEADAWEFKDLTGDVTYKPLDDLSFGVSSTYDTEELELTKLNGSAKWGGLSIKMNSKYDIKQDWDSENYKWYKDSDKEKELYFDNINISHNYNLPKTFFWKNRIDTTCTTQFGFTKHFNKVTDSKLYFNLNYSINIYKFLSLSINAKSENNSMFLYFKEDRDKLNLKDFDYEYNILEDLFRSFNFFDEEDRKGSKFNLKSIDIALNYKTPDWNFVVSYKAIPKNNEWYPIYSFFVEWKPLKMVQTKVINEEDKWTAETSPSSN